MTSRVMSTTFVVLIQELTQELAIWRQICLYCVIYS